MLYFRDGNDGFYAILAGNESMLPNGCTQITDAAAALLLAPTPIQLASEKAAVLVQVRLLREIALNRLTGIQLNTTDAPTIAALQVARISLLNITTNVDVIAATDGATTKLAVTVAWRNIAAALIAAAPAEASVFVGLGM